MSESRPGRSPRTSNSCNSIGPRSPRSTEVSPLEAQAARQQQRSRALRRDARSSCAHAVRRVEYSARYLGRMSGNLGQLFPEPEGASAQPTPLTTNVACTPMRAAIRSAGRRRPQQRDGVERHHTAALVVVNHGLDDRVARHDLVIKP
jgi:hypothetical protein